MRLRLLKKFMMFIDIMQYQYVWNKTGSNVFNLLEILMSKIHLSLVNQLLEKSMKLWKKLQNKTSTLAVDKEHWSQNSFKLFGEGWIKKNSIFECHDLTVKNLMNWISICKSLLKRNEIESFFKWLITGDEKWITYDNCDGASPSRVNILIIIATFLYTSLVFTDSSPFMFIKFHLYSLRFFYIQYTSLAFTVYIFCNSSDSVPTVHTSYSLYIRYYNLFTVVAILLWIPTIVAVTRLQLSNSTCTRGCTCTNTPVSMHTSAHKQPRPTRRPRTDHRPLRGI